MAKTIEQLKAQGAEVKNATAVGENTATRVGTLFTDIVEHVEQYEAGQSADTEANTLAISNEAQARAKADDQLNTAIVAETARATAAEEAIIYDVSSHNDGAVFESLQVLLSSSNLSTLIPTSVRHGGMSIRFIQGSVPNSNNNYVQARCIANEFTTDVTKWQGVDDEPTAGSNNLIKSGGVYTHISNLNKKTENISVETNESNDEFISFKSDDETEEYARIDNEGVHAPNITQLTETVSEHDGAIDVINTKVGNISVEESLLDDEFISFKSDDETEEYARIDENGIHGKKVYNDKGEIISSSIKNTLGFTDIVHFIGYGQSLMVGCYSGATVSTTQLHSNIKKFYGGVRPIDGFGLDVKRRTVVARNGQPEYGEMFINSATKLSQFDNECISECFGSFVPATEKRQKYTRNITSIIEENPTWRTGIYAGAWELRPTYTDYRITQDYNITEDISVKLIDANNNLLPFRLQLYNGEEVVASDYHTPSVVSINSSLYSKFAIQVRIGTGVDDEPYVDLEVLSHSTIIIGTASEGVVQYIKNDNGIFYNNHGDGETPMTGFAESLNNILLEKYGVSNVGFEILVSTAGYGSAQFYDLMPLDRGGRIQRETQIGTEEDDLDDGTNMNYFEVLMLSVTKAKEIADAQNKSYSVNGLIYFEESTDFGNTARLKAYRTLQLFTLINERVKNITHQSNDIVVMVHQSALVQTQTEMEYLLASKDKIEWTESEINYVKNSMGLYQIEPYDLKNVIFSTPMYGYQFVDGVHKTSFAQRLIGATFADTYVQNLINSKKDKTQSLTPQSYKVVGNDIYVKFNVPNPPLVLDDNAINGTQTCNAAIERGDKYGFIFKTKSEYVDIITNVSVYEPDTIKIVCSESPIGKELQYAYKITLNTNWDFSGKSSPFGNLRDSNINSITINSNNYYLYKWGIGFCLNIL